MKKTTRKTWTDEKIFDAVRKMMDADELDRMPSHSEIAKHYGNYSLTNAITRRHGGWYGVAEAMGLDIKRSETYFGKSEEHNVMEELTCMGFEVAKMPMRFPYDLLVEDCVKVEVKVSRLYEGKTGNFYSFNLEKPFCTCDVYVLRLLSNESVLQKSLIVPSKFVARNTQISVGEIASKYYRFENRWDYISEYCEFFSAIC